jgi:hypothetical protein
MSPQIPRFEIKPIFTRTVCFLAAYGVASALDLGTTRLAISLTHAREGNVFATSSGAYDGSLAWLITFLAAVPLTALFAFGIVNVNRVADRWLDRPSRSFLSLRANLLFTIPWSRRVLDRSPLHAIAVATAFVVLRLLAAANNTLIIMTGAGPLGLAVEAVGKMTSPALGFVLVLGPAYILLILAAASVAARIIKSGRSSAPLPVPAKAQRI